MCNTGGGQDAKNGLGNYEQSSENKVGQTMHSEEAGILDNIKQMIGAKTASSSTLSFVLAWMVEKAFRMEVETNWEEAVERVQEKCFLADANIISNHTLFTVRTEDDGILKLKSRIVVHGHLDAEKDDVRADCAAADMLIVRLLLFLCTCLGFPVWLFGH